MLFVVFLLFSFVFRDPIGFIGNIGPYIPFKWNIRGYSKALLKAILGNFGLFWPYLALFLASLGIQLDSLGSWLP